MDFQSRVNQFRSNMDDQQKSYNSMASSASNFGRTVLKDKVAEHYAYMEKVGGITTGAFAGAKGAKNMGQRIQKYRQSKTALQNNTKSSAQSASSSEESSISSRASESSNQSTINSTNDTKVKAPDSLDASEEYDSANSRARGGKIAEFANEGDEGGGSSSSFTAGPATEDAMPKPATITGTDGQTTTLHPNIKNVGQGLDDSDIGQGTRSLEQTVSSNVVSGGADLSEDAAGGILDTVRSGARAAAGAVGRASGAVSDTMDAVGTVVKQGVGKVIGEAGADLAADAVPFLGEAVGLGMLIANIVKAHKHEENAGPPKLSAASAEPTEQSGGMNTSMLKMSEAPTIT